jgi:hypothetical protein
VQYHNVQLNRAPIAAYADRLLAAEALVLVYPVWNEGFPAILKGLFYRVFIPGVSFKIGPDGAAVPNLQSCENSLRFALMAPVARPVSCLETRPSAWSNAWCVRCPATQFAATIWPITIWNIPTPSSGAPPWRRSTNICGLVGQSASRRDSGRKAVEGVGYLTGVIRLWDKSAALW